MASTYSKKEWLPENWGTYNCEGLLDDYEGFRILTRGEARSAPMYRISFEAVESYCSVEESSCINDTRRKPGLTQSGWCFQVENSWFLKEFHEISSGIRKDFDYRHFAFYFANQCIDVIAFGEPIIENLNE